MVGKAFAHLKNHSEKHTFNTLGGTLTKRDSYIV